MRFEINNEVRGAGCVCIQLLLASEKPFRDFSLLSLFYYVYTGTFPVRNCLLPLYWRPKVALLRSTLCYPLLLFTAWKYIFFFYFRSCELLYAEKAAAQKRLGRNPSTYIQCSIRSFIQPLEKIQLDFHKKATLDLEESWFSKLASSSHPVNL